MGDKKVKQNFLVDSLEKRGICRDKIKMED